MILQALVDYYEELALKGKIEHPGWSKVKVSWALELGEDGTLLAVHPLREPSENGKKMMPRRMEMPAPVKRSSGVAPNCLCDHSSYLLGADQKGNPARTEECYVAAKRYHREILSGIDSTVAKAILLFFDRWSDDIGSRNQSYQMYKEELLSGENITFMFEGRFAAEYPEIREAWQHYYDNAEDGDRQTCLITGKDAVPQSVHPAIKNVRDAQSSGAALVSFNKPAFCSFGKEQNQNAPVGKYAAFAYTSALNYLLSDKEHVKYIGNAATVYWARDAEDSYQDIFSGLLDGPNERISADVLNGIMEAVTHGKSYDYAGIPVSSETDFYILGLSPNAARLSVRFFYHNSFGNIVGNIRRHYDDIRIGQRDRGGSDDIPLWLLLRETVNMKASDKAPLPQMAGDMLKCMISGGRYPETLMNQMMLRIRAEHAVTRGRAAIIKGYLIRNANSRSDSASIKEVSTVVLNKESTYTPYVLGRLFSVLEGVQQSANPGINATIKDRFFNSACATPGAVFPILLKLSNSHLRKMDAGKTVFWSRQVSDLLNRMNCDFPGHLSLQEQGAFILGYYHQTQDRYGQKTPENKEEQ